MACSHLLGDPPPVPGVILLMHGMQFHLENSVPWTFLRCPHLAPLQRIILPPSSLVTPCPTFPPSICPRPEGLSHGLRRI